MPRRPGFSRETQRRWAVCARGVTYASESPARAPEALSRSSSVGSMRGDGADDGDDLSMPELWLSGVVWSGDASRRDVLLREDRM